MKHPSNRELFEYWNERRGPRLAPERADIEPCAIRHVLGDTFVLEANGIENHLFRIAGTRLCALFGRELKAESFIRLWQRPGQNAIRELIAVVMEEKVGIVASVTGATSDDTLAPGSARNAAAAARLPVARRGPRAGRAGADGSALLARRQGGRPAHARHVPAYRRRGRCGAPRFKAAAGRLKHGLTVYDGGRAGLKQFSRRYRQITPAHGPLTMRE